MSFRNFRFCPLRKFRIRDNIIRIVEEDRIGVLISPSLNRNRPMAHIRNRVRDIMNIRTLSCSDIHRIGGGAIDNVCEPVLIKTRNRHTIYRNRCKYRRVLCFHNGSEGIDFISDTEAVGLHRQNCGTEHTAGLCKDGLRGIVLGIVHRHCLGSIRQRDRELTLIGIRHIQMLTRLTDCQSLQDIRFGRNLYLKIKFIYTFVTILRTHYNT